jgi:hypothetical protein
LAVHEDSEEKILEWIETQTEKCEPITRTYIRNYCEAKYSHSVRRGLIDSFILRHRDDLMETKSICQEDSRLEVLPVFLDEIISYSQEYVQGLKAELVFNLDEVGMSEWEDRKDEKVIVAMMIDGQTIHYRALQNVKQISIITCIIAG